MSRQKKYKVDKKPGELLSLLKFSCFLLLLLSSSVINAQSLSVTLKPDSTHILIGDYLNAKLTVKCPNDYTVTIPTIADTLGNMDLIKTSKIDTAINGSSHTLTQTYIVSAYDSGQFRLGPEKIKFKRKDGLPDSILTDIVFIKVTTVAVDTTKPFKAIKAPLNVPYSWKEFLPYIIGGGALLVILAIAVYFLWRSLRKKKPVAVARPRPKDPAHIWARKELRKLEEEKLWQKDEIKKYYSKLSDILRLYLEYRYGWFALESTTEEIKENINSYKISTLAKENLFMILENADLVKFAKMMPLPDVNTRALENAYKFIEYTEQKEITPQESNV